MNANWIRTLLSVSLFTIYIIVSCLGLYLIKAAACWKTSVFAVGFLLYGAGAAIWMLILRLTPLSLAFPIAAGSLMIGTLLTGVFLLNERVTFMHVAGVCMIIAGVAFIAANR